MQPPIVGESFLVDGILYSTAPVFQGTVSGFSYSAIGAGISDGESGGARVWYGPDSCVSFRLDGSGVQDLKGGTTTTIDSFPWVELDFVPGTQGATIMPMRGYGYPMRSVLDPEYSRRGELRPFQWGVRLRDDGTVHVDSNGYYEFFLKFEDGTAMRAAWNPQTNGPATNFFAGDLDLITGSTSYRNTLREYSHALPSESHFCYFKEQTAVSLEPYCLENVVPSLNNAVRRLCYAKGQLEGSYQLTDQYGATLEAGSFSGNRPAEGWTFWHTNGELAATGRFSEQGVHSGDWLYYDTSGVQRETVPFSSVIELTERGIYERVLDGTYTEHRSQDGYPRLTGRLLEGRKEGWWYTYGDLQTLMRGDEYEAATQIPYGTECDSEGNCTELTQSWLKSTRHYVWQACGVSYPYIKDVTFNVDGSFISESCAKIEGTPLDFSIGEQLAFCPYHCM